MAHRIIGIVFRMISSTPSYTFGLHEIAETNGYIHGYNSGYQRQYIGGGE